ncbi:toll/interleukin-1 receptor domain-containing protein [Undibacterium sp.]|uniref:toll/interleukin-1 receptor domain-containing protein n=1 Tax=Undibacterium sp. TaxID=1914977 RepID=UPI0037513393
MSSIFVSYRSLDYDKGVAALYDKLVALYGSANVTLDRESFQPGATWLPQILSRVAMSEIVLCVIGPSWASSKERASSVLAVDYVAEELALAKKLGKPILPISINVELSEVLKNLPPQLSWLSNLQFFKFDVLANDIGADVGASINKLSGIMPVGHSDGTATISAQMKLATLYALRSVVGCVLNPTRYAAAALQSTHSSLWQSVLLSLVSLFPLSLSGTLIVGQLSIFALAKMLVLIVITTSLFYATFFCCQN